MSRILEQEDLPLRDYDRQSGVAIAAKLRGFSQRELRLIGTYEARHEARPAVLERVAELRAKEPWSGYDDAGADAIAARVEAANASRVLVYEREHKARTAVIEAAARALSS
jgi:hypothetical protein